MAIALLIDTLLPRLLAASIQGTLLVTLVWALCRALPRLSAYARCWLWWLVSLWASLLPPACPILPMSTRASICIPPRCPLAWQPSS